MSTTEVEGAGSTQGESAIAARVASLFSTVFDAENVGPHDDFFDLGGDSLIAEALMASIEKEFGVTLSVSTVLHDPTPTHLARKIVAAGLDKDETAEERCIVPIRPGGTGIPIVCVHGMTGNSEFARRLAEKVLLTRQVFGFRAMGLRRGEVPIPTVQKIATHYISELKSVRPNGPYIIYGQCPTAVIAYEIAQQLVAAGETIAGMVLVDPYPPIPWLQYAGMQLIEERLKLQEMFTRQMARMPAGGYLTPAGREKFIYDLFRPIVGAYVPKPLAAKTLLICTIASASLLLSKTTGFPSVLPNIETAKVGMNHLDPFKGDSQAVSELIADFLDRVAPT